MALNQTLTRPIMLVVRALQWVSAVIVMGITSYFLARGPKGGHIVYQEVIAVLSVIFFLPAFISPFKPNMLSRVVLGVDVVFSYLWLTSFIFASQDYNTNNCYLTSPPFTGCSTKKANEAFIFLAFIFTFFGMLLELFSLWSYRRGRESARPDVEKRAPGGGLGTAGGTVHDGPATSVP